MGRWVFGGGTSLSAAWQITPRYSQDIDGILFVEGEGYAYTEALTSGTRANDILRAGYDDAVNDTVWSDAPGFAEALEAVRSLDDHGNA